MKNHIEIIEKNLLFILMELRQQPEIAMHFPPEMQSYDDQLSQVEEYLVDAGEYGLGYEIMVLLLATFPFRLSGLASVKLLEVGLLLGFKTEMSEDVMFDRRA
ncbi:hypothetical protein [Herbaspirillum seropedicae]|uniref:hypothetical protein n=1 Tax=Herbaspirillum seropedicae TaxID=964 RepID=UPI003D99FEA7